MDKEVKVYVEVIYLNDKPWTFTRTWQHYSDKEAKKKYDETVAELIADETPSLVCLRDDTHELITSKLNFYDMQSMRKRRSH
jgi:hypothetical protein